MIMTRESKTHMSLYMPTSIKRRLQLLATDKKMTMNDLIVRAVADMLDHYDNHVNAPDIVLERLSDLTNAQIATAQLVNEQNGLLSSLVENTRNRNDENSKR